MELKELNVSDRGGIGSSGARRLRAAGQIPGVVYSGGNAALSISVDRFHFDRVIGSSSQTQLFKLKSAAQQLNDLMVLVKEVQHEPLQDRVLHFDLLSVREDQPITVTVPIKLTGECAAAKLGEMILNQTLYELEVECLPVAIPEYVTLDITTLTEGHSLHASDIVLPERVRLKSDPALSAVTLLARAEEEAASTVTTAPAAAAAEGAAPAAAAAPAEKEGGKEKEKTGK